MKMSTQTPNNTITRDVVEMASKVGNVYEMVVILSKRANQVSAAEKKELDKILADYSSPMDNSFDEVFNNKEQAEISLQFEKMPKPTLIATQEFLEDELNYTTSSKDDLLKDE